MNFKIVDIGTWSRGDVFRYFIDQLRNVINMTVEVDVTLSSILCTGKI